MSKIKEIENALAKLQSDVIRLQIMFRAAIPAAADYGDEITDDDIAAIKNTTGFLRND